MAEVALVARKPLIHSMNACTWVFVCVCVCVVLGEPQMVIVLWRSFHKAQKGTRNTHTHTQAKAQAHLHAHTIHACRHAGTHDRAYTHRHTRAHTHTPTHTHGCDCLRLVHFLAFGRSLPSICCAPPQLERCDSSVTDPAGGKGQPAQVHGVFAEFWV